MSSNRLVIRNDVNQVKLDLHLSNRAARCAPRVVDGEHHPLSLYSVALMQKQGARYIVMDIDPRTPERYDFVPGQYLLVALTPALPRIAFRREVFEPYAGRATPITLTAGETLAIELVAIEDHPLARDPWSAGIR